MKITFRGYIILQSHFVVVCYTYMYVRRRNIISILCSYRGDILYAMDVNCCPFCTRFILYIFKTKCEFQKTEIVC